MYIVIDAKFYQNTLTWDTIQKTLEDMKLRNAFGIIICSADTKISGGLKFEMQNVQQHVRILKLKTGSDDPEVNKFVELDLISEKELKHHSFMLEYLTCENKDLIKSELINLIEVFKQECKTSIYKSLFKNQDDTYSQSTSQSTAINICEDQRKKLPKVRSSTNIELETIASQLDNLLLFDEDTVRLNEEEIKEQEKSDQANKKYDLIVKKKIQEKEN